MDDFISRTAAKEAIHDKVVSASTVVRMWNILNGVPAVDVAPVIHGRWIDIPDKPEWDQKMCSVCGDYRCCQGNYCSNCGAKMDE